MKIKHNGFTLMELLAVIVILAVIALISTPLILDVVDNARTNAAKSSADGYIDAVENLTLSDILSGETTLTSGTYDVTTIENSIQINGDYPTEGNITIDYLSNVVYADLCINNKEIVYYNNETKVVADNCTTLSYSSYHSFETDILGIGEAELSYILSGEIENETAKIGNGYVFDDLDGLSFRDLDMRSTEAISYSFLVNLNDSLTALDIFNGYGHCPRIYIDNGGEGNRMFFAVRNDEGYYTPLLHDGGYYFYPNIETWINFVITYDGSVVKLYLDGVELLSDNLVYIDSELRPNFGGVYGGVSASFTVDEFYLYDRALTGEEVGTIYSKYDF